jgi:hypothetical protein
VSTAVSVGSHFIHPAAPVTEDPLEVYVNDNLTKPALQVYVDYNVVNAEPPSQVNNAA